MGERVLDVLVRIVLVMERPFGFKIGVSILTQRSNLVSVRQGLSPDLEHVGFCVCV